MHVNDARSVIQAVAETPLGHAAGDEAPFVAIAVEVERDAFSEVGAGRVLQVQVDVRLAAVAGVADAPEQLAGGDPLAGRYGDGPGLQVSDEEILVRRHLDADVVAEAGQPPAPVAYLHLGLPVVRREDDSGGGRIHRQPVGVVVVEGGTVGREGAPVPRNHQVVGPALVGEIDVVVDLGGGATPGDRQRLVERQAESHLARLLVVRRGIRVVHGQREDDREQGGVGEQLPDVRAVLPAVGGAERQDEQDGGRQREDDRPDVPEPEREMSRASPQRCEQEHVRDEHARYDAHPAIDRPPLGRIGPRQRTQRAPASILAIGHPDSRRPYGKSCGGPLRAAR